jgi:ABC-2 type transport system permease protein
MNINKNSIAIVRILVKRDLTLRYKRSFFGVGWTLLNPLLTSFVMWIVFSFIFGPVFPSGQKYAPYLIIGVLFLSFWNQGLIMSAESIAGNSSIITKVKVKVQLFTVSSTLAAYVNFLVGFIPLLIICGITRQKISPAFPLVFIIGFFFVLFISGIGLCLSIVFIRFEDARNMVNVLLLILGYLTPIFYPISALSERVQYIVNLNPLTSYLNCFRWSLFADSPFHITEWLSIFGYSIFFYWLGSVIFRRNWSNTVSMI